MAVNRPFGFRESRHLGGAFTPSTRLYKVSDQARSGFGVKYKGNPIIFCSGDVVGNASAISANVGDDVPLLGICRAVYTNSNGKPRPTTFNQPSAGPVLLASVAGFVEVNVDPNQTYVVACDTTASNLFIGAFVGTTAGAANTAAGLSGWMIKTATVVAVPTTATPFQIVGVAAGNLDPVTIGGNEDYEVKIANHAFTNRYPTNTHVKGA